MVASGVRPDGHLAAGHHPVHRKSGDDAIKETDYFDELDSPNLIVSEEVEVEDYNSYHADESSPPAPPLFSSPAERLFGGLDDNMTYGREQR